MMAKTTDSLLAAVMSDDYTSLTELLKKSGTDVNQADEYGLTPLIIASLRGQFQAVQSLVQVRADINKTCENTTALMFAASISSYELERVYKQGALVLSVSSDLGENTLFPSNDSEMNKAYLLQRMLQNKTKIIECLLQAGADPNVRDEDGRNALILLTENNLSECFSNIFTGSVPAMIQREAKTELLKRCQYLIDHHVDINTTDNDGMTALVHAVRNRLDNVCKLFLDHKGDVNIVDNNGNTALMYALLTGSKHLCRLLLQNGAILGINSNERLNVHDRRLMGKPDELCKILPYKDSRIDVHGITNAVTRKTESVQFTVSTVRNDIETLTGLWDILAMACCRRTTTTQTVSYDFDPLVSPDSVLGKTLLLIAVANNSLELCKFSLDHGVDPNIKDNNKTALINTILVRSRDMCDLLLQHGAQPDLIDVAGKTALMYAVIHGLTDFADVLISYGADVSLQDVTGKTALMYAINCKKDDCCQLLLKRGADVNIQNKDERRAGRLTGNEADLNVQDAEGRTAMMYAAMNSVQTCMLLTERKTDFNIQDKYGMTAVLYCAQKSLLDPLRVLLSAGANPDVCNNKGISALWYTVWNNSFDCCKLLVDHGVNLNIQDEDGMTPVLYCAQKCFIGPLRVLLSAGANPDLCNNKGISALWYTVWNNSFDCCKLLVDHGVNLNIQDEDGMTPVLYCAQKCFIGPLRVLLSAGANPNLCNNKGMSALWYTAWNNSFDCCKLLMNHGVNINIQDEDGMTLALVLYCTQKCFTGPLRVLLSAGVNPDSVDHKGRSALMYTVLNNSPDMCEDLILHGADVNIQDRIGMSVMMYAVLQKSYKLLKYFLSLGMDPNEQMSHAYVPNDTDGGDENVTFQDLGRGKSAFQLAVILNSDEMCQLMMSYGADVNKQDRDGRTALMYAALHNSRECFLLLMEFADLTVEDKDGRTVLFYITNSEYIQIVQEMGLENRETGEGENVSLVSLLLKDVNLFTHLQHDNGIPKMFDQVCILLENGASPILEPSERSLLHKANSSQLSVHENKDCLKHLQLKKCIKFDKHQLLRLLVCNGVVPSCGSQSSICYPVMQKVREKDEEDVFKYLIANCYLTDRDVAYMRDWGQYRNMANANIQIPDQMFQHPWPLVKLAFISVSTALGGGPCREARVSKTGLPVKLQDMLMFRQPAAQIPVREWEDIELCFDPVKYEELPRPRPLLYYWPLGRQV